MINNSPLTNYSFFDIYSTNGETIDFFGLNPTEKTLSFGKLDPKSSTVTIENNLPAGRKQLVMQNRAWTITDQKIVVTVKGKIGNFAEEFSFEPGKSKKIRLKSQSKPLKTEIALDKGIIHGVVIHPDFLLVSAGGSLHKLDHTTHAVLETYPSITNIKHIASLKDDKIMGLFGSTFEIISIRPVSSP